MSKVVLILGTKKGLFTLTSDQSREKWTQDGPFLQGNEVTHGTLDTRDGSMYATDNNPWFGPRVGKSTDMGANWTFGENAPKFTEDSGKSVAKGWPSLRGVSRSRASSTAASTRRRCSSARTAA